MTIAQDWRSTFYDVIRQPEFKAPLVDTAGGRPRAPWTEALTAAVVETCRRHTWACAALRHPPDVLPHQAQEYLRLDVTAFDESTSGWVFPEAVFELENDRRRAAYSLWKVLWVRTPLRVVFCYGTTDDEAGDLVAELTETVIVPMRIEERVQLRGDTLVVVGLRGDATSFPHDFFRWRRLDPNTGHFEVMQGRE